MFRSSEGVLYVKVCDIPVIAATDPDPSYLCCACGAHTWSEGLDLHVLQLKTCESAKCISKRIRQLLAAEAEAAASSNVLKRIAAAVIPDVNNSNARELRTTLLAFACAAAHEVCNAEDRRKGSL
jgi:hypothetical protein